ncbi:MAG TPA: hypothetical protein VLA77_03215 [Candidatus Saccharimonadales bacterium]|nr:hypothetical protein [Candidatus Saccharimonadales bacterium]
MSEVPSSNERHKMEVSKAHEALNSLAELESHEGMEIAVRLASVIESSFDLSSQDKVASASKTIERLVLDYSVDDTESAADKFLVKLGLVADAASVVLAGNQSKFNRDQLADLMFRVVKIFPNSREYRDFLGKALAPFIMFRCEYAGVYAQGNDIDQMALAEGLLEEGEWFLSRMREYELGPASLHNILKNTAKSSRRQMRGKK